MRNVDEVLGIFTIDAWRYATQTQWPYNPIVVRILRSPLHRMMSRSTMLITFRGHRSGKEYTTPINYVRNDGELLAVASGHHTWWKNFRGSAPVVVRVRGQDLGGTATALEGGAAEEGLLVVLREVPAYRKHWGIELNAAGNPQDPAKLSRIARENVLVRVWDLSEVQRAWV